MNTPRPVPRAPWGAFPLSELCVLLALACAVGGYLISGRQGMTLVVAGVALGCLAGLEVCVREHLAGHRPHALLLGVSAAVALVAGLIAIGVAPPAAGAIGVPLAGLVGYRLRATFARRRRA